jgi:hypothetical protein
LVGQEELEELILEGRVGVNQRLKSIWARGSNDVDPVFSESPVALELGDAVHFGLNGSSKTVHADFMHWHINFHVQLPTRESTVRVDAALEVRHGRKIRRKPGAGCFSQAKHAAMLVNCLYERENEIIFGSNTLV